MTFLQRDIIYLIFYLSTGEMISKKPYYLSEKKRCQNFTTWLTKSQKYAKILIVRKSEGLLKEGRELSDVVLVR